MQKFVIQSSNSDAKLILFEPGPKNIKLMVDGFRARLESHNIPPSESDVFGASGEYLYLFFCGMLENKEEISDWCSIEDHLEIEANRTKEAVELKITLREGPWDEDWEVSENVSLRLNDLKNLLPGLKEFLRVKNAT